MDVITSILALIVTLGILVTVHEYGHFWVARKCGVKVLRFSVGFGKPLYRWYDKKGTEFMIAAIPLGGYVKMLDEREGEVDEAELDQAFTQKTVWQRIAIVAAGPIANFIFAIFAYWVMFMVGVTQLKPNVGYVTQGGPAEQAGVQINQDIVSVDGHKVESWRDIGLQLINRLGETGTIVIEQASGNKAEIDIERWLSDEDEPNPIRYLGMAPLKPFAPALMKAVGSDGPAYQAGIRAGDLIVKAGGEEVGSWTDFVKVVQAHANKPFEIELKRNDELLTLTLIPKQHPKIKDKAVGFADVEVVRPPRPDNLFIIKQENPLSALASGITRTWDMSIMTLESLGKMMQGLLSIKNLSGPITIAKVANDQAKAGFESFISFLAYISIMLGVVNLLPVPVLDGGHLLFYFIEAVRRKPVSETVQALAVRVGLALLLSVMVVAIFNDISRLQLF